jgi:phosphoglycerol transferase
MTTSTLEPSVRLVPFASETARLPPARSAGPGRRLWKEVRLQVVGLVLGLALLCTVMKLWEANLHVPFAYHGDTVLIHMIVKGTVENGWYLHNEALGAPGVLDLQDFPMADTVHLGWIAFLRLFTRDHALIFNLFYLLTFPLTTATAIWALRRLGVTQLWSLVFALLYAFQPYHFLRGTGHYFLSAYYLVPPFLWLVVRIYQGRGPFLRKEPAQPRSAWPPVLTAIAIAVLAGGGGVYYAFFGCFLAMVAGVSASVSLRRWTPLLNAAILSAVTSASLAACLAPSILYWRAHGANRNAVDRSPAMAETLGLKVSQLLMPAPHHRLSALRRWTNSFLDAAPLSNENGCSALGLFASLGFLGLMARLLIRGRNILRTDAVEGLTILSGAAVLLGTVGGFGAVLSWCGVTWIRGYNRISILIAFYALAYLAIAFDRLSLRLTAALRWRRLIPGTAAFLVLAVGVFDQATLIARPAYEQTARQYLADEEFIQSFERSVPAGAMVFELPYQRFVEHVPAPGLQCYDMMRPYLHSRQLHWSYGSIDGRPAHAWHSAVAKFPARELVTEVRAAGFAAIYIDRNGFTDHGAKLEAELRAILASPPLVSKDGRLCIYYVRGKS